MIVAAAMMLAVPAEDAAAAQFIARLRAAGLTAKALPGPEHIVLEVRGEAGLFYIELGCVPPIACASFYTSYRLARPMSAETLTQWRPGSALLETEIDKAGNPALSAEWRWTVPSDAQIDAAIQSWLRASADFWTFALAHQSQ